MIPTVRATFALSSAIILAVVSSAWAQVPTDKDAPFTPAIEALSRKLEADYVFPDIGADYAKSLRDHLAAGDYNGISDAQQIATRLTADLQAFKREGHLRVRVIGQRPSSATKASSDAPPPIKDAKWIAPEVAYISFTLMPDDPQVISATDQFMREHASARALIIDARENHGGGEGVPSTIFKYLFPEPIVLDYFDERTGVNDDSTDDPFERPPVITKAPGPPGISRTEFTSIPDKTEHRLFKARVFYLTSGKTGSAAEQMAEALKRTRRATIIGERTAGAGHFGFFVPVGQNLEAFIPWGRVLDSKTGEDYEGSGITPDVLVPADQALDRALHLAESSSGR